MNGEKQVDVAQRNAGRIGQVNRQETSSTHQGLLGQMLPRADAAACAEAHCLARVLMVDF
jgi:hypothetical protein